MFVFALMLLVANNIHRTNSGYVEIVKTGGCESCKLSLTCRRLSSVIAILEADFTQTPTSSNTNTVAATPFPPTHPRDALNQRCSGVNHCSFIFTEDCPGAEYLGPGNISIKYACITEDRIKKYCNTDILLPKDYTSGISEGFIHNPGYPRFYSGQRICRWRITAHAPQKVKITILDISLIVDNVQPSVDCTDVLEVLDTGQVIHSSCRQEHPPTEVLSGSESVEVVLNSTDDFNPRRGVLMYYTVVGCPDLEVPSDAYLMYRNKQLVVLSCCLGYAFPDTGRRTKAIKCLGAYWNTSLPLVNCEKTTERTHFNQTVIGVKVVKAQNMASDLLAPILIIVVLFIINAIIVFFIQKAKRRQEIKDIRDEELGTFTSSPVDT